MQNQPLLNQEELIRYSRQMVLESIGLEGQRKLKNARVLCVGAGGLASPLLLYLAAAGVGTLGIMDQDELELSNLHRQILFQSDQLKKNKAELAQQQLQRLNPHIHTIAIPQHLTPDNAVKIISSYDIIADCSDNFATRYLLNDTCFALNKPYCFASINQFEGLCSLFTGKKGPCYRCLFPHPPQPHEIPNCNDNGVLGVVPGLLGTLQATEILKFILNLGTALNARVLKVNLLDLHFKEFTLNQNKNCALCVQPHSPTELTPPKTFCQSNNLSQENIISAQELSHLLHQKCDFLLIDVRTVEEHVQDNIGGVLIPLAEFPQRIHELDQQQDIIIYCKSGFRSLSAVKFLLQAGFHPSRVKSLSGGITAWRDLY